MQREARGPVQPITCRQRGPGCHLHANGVIGGGGSMAGGGPMLSCQLRRFWREHGTVRSRQAASVETHLLVLIWSTKAIYTLLNQTCRMHAPPPPSPSPPLAHGHCQGLSNTN